MSKQNWQLQRKVPTRCSPFEEWRDICTAAPSPGPASKAIAQRHLATIRTYCTPGEVYRIVKVSPL